jgi:hypothetical protein
MHEQINHHFLINIFNMDSIDTYPLTLDLAHKWDDEADSKIKTSIISFLTRFSSKPAHEVAVEVSRAFKAEHNIDGFRDGVEDIFIYTSKYLPANHISQDRLVEIVQALRKLPHVNGHPQWQYIFQSGSYMLVEAEGKKHLRFTLLGTSPLTRCSSQQVLKIYVVYTSTHPRTKSSAFTCGI